VIENRDDRKFLAPPWTFAYADTLSLGDREFHLSAYDYTFLWDMEEGRPPRCVSAFFPLGRHEGKAIILGTAFLQRYYTVFDLDSRTIGSKST
jgi:hypothetical protein